MKLKKNQCSRCLKVFKYNCYLEKHKNASRQCQEVLCDRIDRTNEKIDEIQIKDNYTDNQIRIMRNEIDNIKRNIEYELPNSKKHIYCEFCYKVFTTKKSLNRHVKKICKNVNENITIYERELNIIQDNAKNQCKYCKFIFTESSNYCRHMKKGCKEKVKYEIEMERKVVQNRSKAAQQVTNNNIHVTNNIINLPPLRAFGDENLDYVTTTYLLQELNKCKNYQDMSKVVGNFTKMIHANPAHPENHNVQMKSLNGGFARVFNGINFEDRQALDIQDAILQKVGTLITDKCDEYQEQENYIENKSIDTKLECVRDTIDDDILINIASVGVGCTASKTMNSYRSNVKTVLHTNKSTIGATQTLLDDPSSFEIENIK